MANETFYVRVKTQENATAYAFSRSATGILDYAGETTPTDDVLSQMQCVEGSAYFTLRQASVAFSIKFAIRPANSNSSIGIFSGILILLSTSIPTSSAF